MNEYGKESVIYEVKGNGILARVYKYNDDGTCAFCIWIKCKAGYFALQKGDGKSAEAAKAAAARVVAEWEGE